MPEPIADRIVQAASKAVHGTYGLPGEHECSDKCAMGAEARAAAVAVLDGLLNSGLWQHEYVAGGGLRITVNYREVEHLRDDIEQQGGRG